MFRIIVRHDILNKDPKERKKIKGFIVECGYNCQSSCWCPHGMMCKHRAKYRWNNFSVSVSNFLYRKFHIDFHFPIYFQKHSVDLSGTTKCPHQIPRLYTCYDCEYSRGDRVCGNKVHNEMAKQGRASEIKYPYDDYAHRRMCKLFKPNPYCNKYDKNTGEFLR